MITYEYDAGGNIQNKKEYWYYSGTASSTPSKTINYTYGNTNWKDQLTAYNGKAITYDEIGNPLSYDGNTYTWQKGRQLVGISNNTNTITYKYSYEGIRTQKTVNGTTSIYYLEGSKVIYEQTGENITYYTYDENGQIIGINYNNTQYYYIKNAQNDIVGILDSSLKQIVSYEYDSWGKVISIKDAYGNNITSSSHMGKINPYRYRSYRYDEETGLYYLNSRYYNPEWGRFINVDGILVQSNGLNGNNVYSYCENNPISRIDENGYSWSNIWNGIKNAWNSYWDWVDKPIRKSAANIAAMHTKIIAQTIDKQDKRYVEKIIDEYNTAYSASYNAISLSMSYASGVSNIKPKVSKYTYTKTATSHLKERPYMKSSLLIEEITRSKPKPDVYLKNGLKWNTPGYFNGTQGVWELVVDKDSQKIVHFLFRK